MAIHSDPQKSYSRVIHEKTFSLPTGSINVLSSNYDDKLLAAGTKTSASIYLVNIASNTLNARPLR